MGSGGDEGRTYDGCDGKTTCESTNNITMQPIMVFLLFFCISVFRLVHGVVRSSPHLQRHRRNSGGDGGSTSNCFGKIMNSSERKRQNYATSERILIFFALMLFSEIVGPPNNVWSNKIAITSKLQCLITHDCFQYTNQKCE
jgi:hypothetical protein